MILGWWLEAVSAGRFPAGAAVVFRLPCRAGSMVPRVVFLLIAGDWFRGQSAVSAWRRLNAAVMTGLQGQVANRRSRMRRAAPPGPGGGGDKRGPARRGWPRTSRAAAENRRSRSRLGSRRRVGPVRASMAIQGEELAGQGDDFAPDLVLGVAVQGEVAQAGVLGAPDALFAPGAAVP